MKTTFAIAILLSLSACNDGVPAVEDPHNIIIDGKKMPQHVFMDKYCVFPNANQNMTCVKVGHAMSKDSSRGPMPKGW